SDYNPHRPRPKNPGGLMKNLRKSTDGRLYWHWDPAFFKNSDLANPARLQNKLNQACLKINFSTLLVRGMKSDVVTEESVEDLRSYISHLEVFEVSKAGHMITGDSNAVFNAGIEEFISHL